MKKPHFDIANKSQQYNSGRGGFLYQDILSTDILNDICKRITGVNKYTCSFNDIINEGRLAILKYEGKTS